MVVLAQIILIAFGLFFIAMGFLMLFNPVVARATLRKAGSTPLINYGEITLRMIPAAALIVYAPHTSLKTFFSLAGWFMLITSWVLYFVPMKLHHNFSNRCADVLKPFYFQLIAPFSMAIGCGLIYIVVFNH